MFIVFQQLCAGDYAYLLIMFNHLHLASETLKKKIISETKKITSQKSQSSIPIAEIDWLLWLISKEDDEILKEVSFSFSRFLCVSWTLLLFRFFLFV